MITEPTTERLRGQAASHGLGRQVRGGIIVVSHRKDD